MILKLINNTAVIKTYASGAVTLPASSNVTVSVANQLATAVDGNLFSDVTQSNVSVSDNVNIFVGNDALSYLNRLISTQVNLNDSSSNGITSTSINSKQRLDINSSSEGVDGSAAPYGTTQMGGKDGGGNLQSIATDTSGNQQIVGNIAAGVTDSGNGVKASGVYNSTLPTYTTGQRADLQLDANGRMILGPSSTISAVPSDGTKASYSAAKLGLTPQGSDIFTITGSATKTIRVTRIEVSFTQSIYNENEVVLIKRSTANTGGSSTAVPAVPHDSNNSAATATVLSYTSNPTVGTAVGTVRVAKVFGQATSEPYAGSMIVVWDFGNRPSQAVVLRGITQVLAINLNSVTISGASFDISIEWTEE